MSKNPFINAFSAELYILLLVTVMSYGTKRVPGPDTFMAPLIAVSVFTLSAAVMGYIFCLQPILLYVEGKKKQAVHLFIQTTLAFACITAAIMFLFFSGIFS